MTNPSVNTYVTIRDHCPMRYHVVDSDTVEFSFGGVRDPFEFVYDATALRDFLHLATMALHEMDERGQASAE
ncbi:hypothetical protein [Actinophytocola sp. NPDC049390]|uniref:hypothetical protein n=1 Tax=Actinophytocola sp. NPDC049390 TaxID=3363894 RepID=UPI0037882E20